MKLLIKVDTEVVAGCVIVDSIQRYIKKIHNKEAKVTLYPNWGVVDVIRVFFCVDILKKIHKVIASVFFEKSLLSLYIGKVNCGRYIAAASSRSDWRYIKPLRRKYIILGKIVKGLMHYTRAKKISKNLDYAYFHHTEYFEGIYFDLFLSAGISCFYSQYPSFVMLKGKNYNRIDACTVNRAEDTLNISVIDNYMEKRLKDPKSVICYYNVDVNINNNLISCADIVIYAHSFSDAQLMYGNDGFFSVYDWLVFTLNILKNTKRKVIVKGHPNFYAKGYKSNVIEMDLKIWNIVVNRFSKYKNIHFIKTIESNFSLLSRCDNSKTTLITHHGNAIVEGLYLGFNGISSICSPWGRQYNICKMWSCISQYREILLSNNIGYCDRNEVYQLINDLYLDDKKHGNNNHYLSKIVNFLGVDIGEYIKNPNMFVMRDYKRNEQYENLVDSICNTIKTVD